MDALPSVLMVFTGGTISMTIAPGRGAVPARSGREILLAVPRIGEYARVVGEDFDRLPGPHWSAERMLALARHLDVRLADPELAGAVVTHGTDTMEETAYLLDLVLATDKPVVLTGAMKTADDPIWDGPGNLIASVRAVVALRGRGCGVTVMMGETLHAARQVVKSHTESLAAFSSSHGGPLGELEADGLHLFTSPAARERIGTTAIEPRVDLVAACAGADARFLRHAVATGARGIVIEALGRGNVPPAMLVGVREACGAGVPVVVASRCGHGRTAPRYGYEGGGVTLLDAGAIFAGDLPAPKARIKLMVLLGSGATPDEIRRSFERPGW
jgi:L-asparaginase